MACCSTADKYGYEDCRFQKDVDENLYCSLCYNVLKEPRTCRNNDHFFCLACISEHLRCCHIHLKVLQMFFTTSVEVQRRSPGAKNVVTWYTKSISRDQLTAQVISIIFTWTYHVLVKSSSLGPCDRTRPLNALELIIPKVHIFCSSLQMHVPANQQVLGVPNEHSYIRKDIVCRVIDLFCVTLLTKMESCTFQANSSYTQ